MNSVGLQLTTQMSSYGVAKEPLSSQHSSAFIGEITEPFWVQNQVCDPPVWCEPDEVFLQEAKKLISITDKRVFWEMIRAVIELPQLIVNCKSSIKSIRDIATVLKRTENRYLWTTDGSVWLPPQVAADLISSAYVIQQSSDKKD